MRCAGQGEAIQLSRLKWFLQVPNEDGTPWLRVPQTFNLHDPNEYFHRKVLAREERNVSRQLEGFRHNDGAPPKRAAGHTEAEDTRAGKGSPKAKAKAEAKNGKGAGKPSSGQSKLHGELLPQPIMQRTRDHMPTCPETKR